jgi:hypothetical protein
VCYLNDEIVGLNFHQGIDKILYDFAPPCPALTDIYERLNSKNEIKNDIDRINKAIELYNEAYILVIFSIPIIA